jgi:hypothetical protein
MFFMLSSAESLLRREAADRSPVLRTFLTAALVVAISYGMAFAETIKLEWEPNQGLVGGYRLYYGFSTRDYVSNIDVGDITAYDFNAVQRCTTYYFAVTAYDVDRVLESGFSNEVSRSIACTSTRMAVEQPILHTAVDFPFQILGYAIDLDAPIGTGVDTVHVWAFPDDGGPVDWDRGAFMGVASYGATRTDISALYGPQFEPSGFTLTSYMLLPSGNYIFTAYAHSTVSGTFNNSDSVPVDVEPVAYVRIEQPAPGFLLGPQFRVSGWAIDTGVAGSAGIEEVHVWAFPNDGTPVSFTTGTFLGLATDEMSRPDIASHFRNPDWENSGYRLERTRPLSVGDYIVRVYARSQRTGTWDGMEETHITVIPSDPRMEVDQPVSGSTVTTPFLVRGFAVDLGATSGVGVDSVHVWAFPESAYHDWGAGTWLGAAALGFSRPDVSALYGGQFDPSGFELTAATPLPSGNYTLSVFARSTVTGKYDILVDVNVIIP